MFMKRLLGTRLGVWGRQRVKDSALKYVTLQMRSVGSVRASRKRTGTECGGQKRGGGGVLGADSLCIKTLEFQPEQPMWRPRDRNKLGAGGRPVSFMVRVGQEWRGQRGQNLAELGSSP
jgi:hypothetical protein